MRNRITRAAHSAGLKYILFPGWSFIPTTMIYNPYKDEWQWGPQLPYGSYDNVLVKMDDKSRKYLLVGGIANVGGYQTVVKWAYVYDWNTDVSIQIGILYFKRYHRTMANFMMTKILISILNSFLY